MHEASIAQAIVQTVLSHAEELEAESVKSVEIELGELSFLNDEQVAFWMKLGFENTVAQDAELSIKKTAAEIKCASCSYEGALKVMEDPYNHMKLPSFSCPECGSADIEITQGKGAVVRNIKIIKK